MWGLKRELNSNYVFLYFNWSRIGLYEPILKSDFFSKLTFQHPFHKLFMAFYNNMNILMMSMCEESIFNLNNEITLIKTTKNEIKLKNKKENMEKQNCINKTGFSENEIPDLKSLKPFEFEPKTNFYDINSSSSSDE